MTVNYVQRQISFTFTLGGGTFAATNSNTLTVSGLRSAVTIEVNSGPGMGKCTGRVYGLTLSQLNSLCSIQPSPEGMLTPVFNYVSISAGDVGGALPAIFTGFITLANLNFGSPPDAVLEFEAHSGIREAAIVLPGASGSGPVDAISLLQNLASSMGLTFENNQNLGQKFIQSPAFEGSARRQAYDICDAIDVKCTIDRGVFAIWPNGGSRGGSPVQISPNNGLIGYPTNWQVGVQCNCFYQPGIYLGGKVQVSGSQLNYANGIWAVVGVTHELEAQMPSGGKWFTTWHGIQVTA